MSSAKGSTGSRVSSPRATLGVGRYGGTLSVGTAQNYIPDMTYQGPGHTAGLTPAMQSLHGAGMQEPSYRPRNMPKNELSRHIDTKKYGIPDFLKITADLGHADYMGARGKVRGAKIQGIDAIYLDTRNEHELSPSDQKAVELHELFHGVFEQGRKYRSLEETPFLRAFKEKYVDTYKEGPYKNLTKEDVYKAIYTLASLGHSADVASEEATVAYLANRMTPGPTEAQYPQLQPFVQRTLAKILGSNEKAAQFESYLIRKSAEDYGNNEPIELMNSLEFSAHEQIYVTVLSGGRAPNDVEEMREKEELRYGEEEKERKRLAEGQQRQQEEKQIYGGGFDEPYSPSPTYGWIELNPFTVSKIGRDTPEGLSEGIHQAEPKKDEAEEESWQKSHTEQDF